MRRVTTTVGILATAAALLGATAAPTQAREATQREQHQPQEEAYFEFTDASGETFVFQLTDPERIAQARDILAGETNPQGVMGTIVTEPADYNPDWSYHLDPASVQFFEQAIEVCDANMRYVEEHLDEVGGAFLPDNVWCPWSSRLVDEVTAP